MTGARVLIVEDNPVNMELVSDLLSLKGYCILRAETAEQGITLAAQELPHLILMDISLPGIDGLTATQALKQDPATAGIPVVALTAHAMAGDEKRAQKAGCSGYISKPIDTRTFLSLVASFIIPDDQALSSRK